MILGYKLVDGIPPPRHQPARTLLLAINSPYDGGWFADSLAGGPEAARAVVQRYLDDPGPARDAAGHAPLTSPLAGGATVGRSRGVRRHLHDPPL